MKIVTLMEDTKRQDHLIKEWGLSLFIETNGMKIVLDTGATGRFIENSRALGLNLKDVEMVLLSHAHADHGGGLYDLLQINRRATVYMHPDSEHAYYGNIGAKLPMAVNYLLHPFVKRSKRFSKYIGLDRDRLKPYGKRIQHVSQTQEVKENIFLFANILKKHPVPEGNQYLLVEKNGQLVLDDFNHELILVIKENDGVVVFTGCCHSGILNILDTVQARFMDLPIKAVVGGFHLKWQPEKDDRAGATHGIRSIAKELSKRKVEKIFTGHCTGSKAYRIIKEQLNDRIAPLYTGCSFEL